MRQLSLTKEVHGAPGYQGVYRLTISKQNLIGKMGYDESEKLVCPVRLIGRCPERKKYEGEREHYCKAVRLVHLSGEDFGDIFPKCKKPK